MSTAAPTTAISVDTTKLVASICRDSFFAFVQEFWDVVIPETPVWNWHIEYLCDRFQEDAQRVFDGLPKKHDTIVNISPGSTKSTILSVMGPAWIHCVRPDMRVLAASHTQQLCFELGRKCRMVEESPKYQACFGKGTNPDKPHLEVVPTKDQWTKSLFVNTAGGARMAATVGGMSPTGFHAHFILVDDPVDPQQAKRATGTELAAANDFMTEVIPSRKVDKATTVTWLIMQRLHQNDPTGHMLSKAKDKAIRHICIPATKSNKVRPLSLRRRYSKDGYMDPKRLGKQVLGEARVDLGEYGYAGQYEQHPVPKAGGMFKPQRIQVDTPPVPSCKGWVQVVRFWDKAGTQDGGAYTAGVKLGRWRPPGGAKDGADDVWWVLHVHRKQLDSAEREALLKHTAKLDRRRVVIGIEQEPGSGGKESAQNTVKRLAGYVVRVVPAVGSKEDRADEWSSMVNAGAYRMAPGDWNQAFIEELQYFPYGTYKDQVDAGAGAHSLLARGKRRVGGR